MMKRWLVGVMGGVALLALVGHAHADGWMPLSIAIRHKQASVNFLGYVDSLSMSHAAVNTDTTAGFSVSDAFPLPSAATTDTTTVGYISVFADSRYGVTSGTLDSLYYTLQGSNDGGTTYATIGPAGQTINLGSTTGGFLIPLRCLTKITTGSASKAWTAEGHACWYSSLRLILQTRAGTYFVQGRYFRVKSPN